jgi:predicted DNA-binding helix-hairpin-helix protein
LRDLPVRNAADDRAPARHRHRHRHAQRLVELRRSRALRYQDLVQLRCAMDRIKPFVVTQDYQAPIKDAPSEHLRRALAPPPAPLALL